MMARAAILGLVTRIYVTRPAKACGQDTGFSKGSAEEKMQPWIQAMTDALKEAFGTDECEVRRALYERVVVPASLAKWRGQEIKNTEVMLLDEAQLADQDQIQMLSGRVAQGGAMVWMGDLAQDGEDRIKAMRRFVSSIVDMGTAAESGDHQARTILSQLRQGGHIKLVQFTSKDIVRSEAVRVLTLLQEYLASKADQCNAQEPAQTILKQLQQIIQSDQEDATTTNSTVAVITNDGLPEGTYMNGTQAGYRVALAVPLFRLMAGNPEAATKCVRELAVNVQRYQQHLFMIVACVETHHQLLVQEWGDLLMSTCFLMVTSERLVSLERQKGCGL
jgi:hypothetical protein